MNISPPSPPNSAPGAVLRPPSSRAFSLVEVALALGLASFCLIALIALIPIGIASNQNAIKKTAAANIATAIMSDLRNTASSTSTNAVSPGFGFNIPPAGLSAKSPQILYMRDDGGVCSSPIQNPINPPGTIPSDARYRVNVGFTPPNSSGQRMVTFVRIQVTWPPQADPGNTSWPTNFTGSFETCVSLDRN